jgi:hypothetical protein
MRGTGCAAGWALLLEALGFNALTSLLFTLPTLNYPHPHSQRWARPGKQGALGKEPRARSSPGQELTSFLSTLSLISPRYPRIADTRSSLGLIQGGG